VAELTKNVLDPAINALNDVFSVHSVLLSEQELNALDNVDAILHRLKKEGFS
jgi:hypothetical protein